MSCNPAIGGLAKGQMVREIDALGGLMPLAADASGIQFKVLNSSKGPAVRGPRAQCDKYAYRAEVQRLLAGFPQIEVFAGTVDQILRDDDGAACGVVLPLTMVPAVANNGMAAVSGSVKRLDLSIRFFSIAKTSAS